MPDHDAVYHRLFSHPGMVAQLLREFVAEPWVGELDLDQMERVNAKFHSDGNERRDSDVIWRIPLNGDAYLLLMLEFQSTPDHWMALRVMVYAGLLWQHLVKEKLLRGIADYRRSSLWSYTMAIRAG
jgi:predicted transposase YdaD